MVVYEKTSRFSFHILHEAKSKVRISEDAYKHDGNLQEIAMERTFDALSDFITISKSFKTRKTLCVATSALRDAPNRYDFLQRVRRELKLNIKIIDGEKEAYLGALSCANLLEKQSNSLTIDIGGGSTEFSIINGYDISNTISLNLGTVRIKELFYDSNSIDEAKKYIDSELDKIGSSGDFSGLIGIGGTMRALSSAIMKSKNYPLSKIHGYEYSIESLDLFITKVLSSDENDLKELGIKANRFDVIKPGSLIIQRVLKRFYFDKIISSGVGVREGVFLSDLLRGSKDRFPANYNPSVRYLIDRHIVDSNYSNQLNLLTKKLFDLTKDYLALDSKYRYELALAAKLYPIGSDLHYYSQNNHSYYLLQTALEYGFSHKQIMLISTLAKYAKKKLPSDEHIQRYRELLPDSDTLNSLSYLLTLSIALLSHKPRNLDFEIEFKNSELRVISKSRLYLSEDAVSKISSQKKDFKIIF
jgi:exopolyphosphatase/guanosine-5'-triphosphate,3'-diphosphate pyrophosphatase